VCVIIYLGFIEHQEKLDFVMLNIGHNMKRTPVGN